MKKIAPHINTYCTFCKLCGHDKVKAIWRISYDNQYRACDSHKPDLQRIEEDRRQFDDQYSEADYQTWMRL